jgi:hypothetical protein
MSLRSLYDLIIISVAFYFVDKTTMIKNIMGTYKSKGIKVDNEKLDRIPPEPNYEVKTRTPMKG